MRIKTVFYQRAIFQGNFSAIYNEKEDLTRKEAQGKDNIRTLHLSITHWKYSSVICSYYMNIYFRSDIGILKKIGINNNIDQKTHKYTKINLKLSVLYVNLSIYLIK